jgi:cytochrome c oxidase subunit 3
LTASVSVFRSADESRRTSFVGMMMALASWTMLFASLFFSYAILRLRSPMWPPEGTEALPKLLPFLNTLVLLGSSLTLHRGLRPAAEEKPGTLLAALRATVFLGALFLALQFVVWIPLWRGGLRFDSGVYGSIFYGLTAFHALHVLCGLAALLWLVPKARRGIYVSGRQSAVRVTAMFWHFVDVVWVLLFVTVYLV